MSLTSSQVAVTPVATALFTSVTGNELVYVQPVPDGSGGVVRFGGTGLTAANGIKALPNGFIMLTIGDVLFGIVQMGTAKVNVFVSAQS